MLRLKKIQLFTLAFLLSSSIYANYSGSWVWGNHNEPNTWLAFRKTITLDNISPRVLTTIAADSKYWMWINGEMVVREGGLKRTPNPNDTYADTLDIQPFLKKGKNTIAVLVWYWGKEGHGHNGSGHGGFFFDARNGKQHIASNKSWKVKQHPAFDTLLMGTQPYRPLAEFNIVFDARKDIEGWTQENFNDVDWGNAQEFATPPQKPWGNLVIRSIPQWKDFGLKDYEGKFPAKSMGNILPMKLPYNAQITPYFKIKAKAGMRVDIRTDCYTDGGAYNVRAEYITKEGVQEFEFPGWMSGEYVWYCFSPEIEILSLKYRESGYNAEFEGSFHCDDEFYNILWKKARRTLYVNMRDNFMDCPTRERAMWWGDVVVESLQSYYVFSSDIYLLTQKAINELMGWQTSEGVIYSPIPGPHPPLMFGPHRELPLQSLAAISKLSLGYYYLFSGDAKTLINAYPAIKRYLLLWKLGEDGLVVHRNGKWNWQDWGTNIDAPLLDNAWYYSVLESTIQIATMAGELQDTAEFGRQMRSIKDNFDLKFWTGREYRSPAYKGETDDRGNAMAVLTGLAEKGRWEDVRKVLNREFHASPYMEKFVTEALLKMGYAEDALERMKKRYERMVYNDYSTLPESWGYEKFSQSRNHGWSGGALSLLMQYVVGIEPIEPSLKRFLVKPNLGHLKNVSAVVPTKYGPIKSSIERDENFIMELAVPSSTKALLKLPDSIIANKNIYINSKKVNKNKDVVVNSGVWRIEVK